MIRKSKDPEHLDAYTDADTSGEILKMGSATLREFTKGQSCQTLSSGKSECYAAVTTTAKTLHFQPLLKFSKLLLKLQLRINSTAARGIIERQGCGPLQHIETIHLWLQATHEERKWTVVKNRRKPTQQTDSRKRCRQQSIWNDGTVVEVDTTTVMMVRRASEKRLRNQDDGQDRSGARDPTLIVNRDFDAANVYDKKTWIGIC